MFLSPLESEYESAEENEEYMIQSPQEEKTMVSPNSPSSPLIWGNSSMLHAASAISTPNGYVFLSQLKYRQCILCDWVIFIQVYVVVLPMQIVYIAFQKYCLRTIIYHWWYLATRWCRLFHVVPCFNCWGTLGGMGCKSEWRGMWHSKMSAKNWQLCLYRKILFWRWFSDISKWLVVFFSLSLLYIVRAFHLLMMSEVRQHVTHFAAYKVLRRTPHTVNFVTILGKKYWVIKMFRYMYN